MKKRTKTVTHKQTQAKKKKAPKTAPFTSKKDAAYWKRKYLESQERLQVRTKQVEILQSGQDIATQAELNPPEPSEIQKLQDRIYELEERLQPFDYEFILDGMLIKVIVRPRISQVIPVTK